MSINKEKLLTAAGVVLHKNSLTYGDLPALLSTLSDGEEELLHDYITQMYGANDAKAFEELRQLSPEQIAQSLA